MSHVLFVCLHNAGRSQISQALFERAAAGRHSAESAGSVADPTGSVHPEVVAVMGELGIDLGERRPQRLTDELAERADIVVTMGCGDTCPYIPGKRYIDWDLPDPKGRPIDEVRALRDEIGHRVDALLDELDAPAAVLRPARPEDLDALVALARHSDLASSLATDAADGLAGALDDGAGELLVIEHDHALAGAVRWVLVNRRSRIADVTTLMLDPAVQGRGLGVAAVRELVARLFTAHGVHRIEAEVYGFNEPAQRVFERVGFTREGVRRRAYDRAGGWQDGIRYGLLADDGAPTPD